VHSNPGRQNAFGRAFSNLYHFQANPVKQKKKIPINLIFKLHFFFFLPVPSSHIHISRTCFYGSRRQERKNSKYFWKKKKNYANHAIIFYSNSTCVHDLKFIWIIDYWKLLCADTLYKIRQAYKCHLMWNLLVKITILTSMMYVINKLNHREWCFDRLNVISVWFIWKKSKMAEETENVSIRL
jgi:hypothetical protein